MPSIVQELDKLIAQAGGTPSGSGLSINEKLKQLNGLIGGTPANVFTYKGSVATADLLPTSGQSVGDVYNIISESDYGPAGTNVAWAGEAWDSLGGTSSGSDALVTVKFKAASSRGNSLTCISHTFEELYAAIESGANVIAYLYSFDGTLSKYNVLSGPMNNGNRPGVYLLNSYRSYEIEFYATYQGSSARNYQEAAVMFPSAFIRFSSNGTCSFIGNTSIYATMRGVYWYGIVLDSETNKKMIEVTYPTEIQNMFTYWQVNFDICFFDNTVTTVHDPFNESGPAPLEYIKHLVAISRTDLSSDPQDHHEWEYTFILSYWDSANNQLAYEKYVGVFNDSTWENIKTLQVAM